MLVAVFMMWTSSVILCMDDAKSAAESADQSAKTENLGVKKSTKMPLTTRRFTWDTTNVAAVASAMSQISTAAGSVSSQPDLAKIQADNKHALQEISGQVSQLSSVIARTRNEARTHARHQEQNVLMLTGYISQLCQGIQSLSMRVDYLTQVVDCHFKEHAKIMQSQVEQTAWLTQQVQVMTSHNAQTAIWVPYYSYDTAMQSSVATTPVDGSESQ